MIGMTTTGEEDELKGTGREKSEGDEKELGEEKEGEQPRVMRRLSQVAIPRNFFSNPFLHPPHHNIPPHCCFG